MIEKTAQLSLAFFHHNWHLFFPKHLEPQVGESNMKDTDHVAIRWVEPTSNRPMPWGSAGVFRKLALRDALEKRLWLVTWHSGYGWT